MSLLVVGICIEGLASRIHAKQENTTGPCVLQEERQTFVSFSSAAAEFCQWNRLSRWLVKATRLRSTVS